ncbi:hypothetical protein EHE22_05820 [Ochrobactrum pseudogrignonense]|uniref:PD(D/E)XK endonuclease domain-containing protein n=1 Tax=Brucella pseudogrignonensis TaxID=419475 RepID=A0A7Y3WWB4_9HYPH|nr:hypothetical protein [Brucella pseudogrignonensis]NNV19946.1 hypothetical protein [Brucella pseudogrignonensis]
MDSPQSQKPRNDNQRVGLAGEFFVAAELSKRGYNVSLTLGNAKSVDILAEIDGDAISIQVKTISRIKSVGWPLPMDKNKIKKVGIFVFVLLNEIGSQPAYFVMQPSKVLDLGKWYSTRAILDYNSIKNSPHHEDWALISDVVLRMRAQRIVDIAKPSDPTAL